MLLGSDWLGSDTVPTGDDAREPLTGSAAGDDLPPEVPAEFAAAYREAYAQALDGTAESAASSPQRRAAHRRAPVGTGVAALWAHTWVTATTAGLVAVILVLGAYGIGKAWSPDSAPGPVNGGTSGDAGRQPPPAVVYRGAVSPVRIGRIRASCTARPGVDAAGHPVSYRASNMTDHDPGTAWRCDGRGVGEKLRFSLPRNTSVVEVGLIPGYAKTDPANGADRYAQNNRITAVRWTIGDQRVVQRFSPAPHDRSLRTMRLPATRADSVVLEILTTERGPRNTTAISEVTIGSVAR